MSILIKDSVIVTQNERREVIQGDVYIENNVISDVGHYRGEADVVLENRVVIPGLFNMHTHLPMTLLRGYGDDLLLEEWLQTRIWPVEARLHPSHIAVGTQLALIEMIRTGTTYCNDMYFFEDVIAEETKRFGMRCHAGFSIIDFDTPS